MIIVLLLWIVVNYIYIMKKYKKGFTLIEILVVIAIIGILSSIILVALSSARVKATDVRVISGIRDLRTQFEAVLSGGNYNSAFTITNGTVSLSSSDGFQALSNEVTNNTSSNAAVYGSGQGTVSGNTKILIVVENGTAIPSGSSFSAPVKTYALYGKLSTGKYYCVDSVSDINPSMTPSGSDFKDNCADH